MKLPTDKCSKYKIINSLNTLSVAGKITDGNKRGPLIFASDAIFTFSTRFVTRYCNKSYNFRKNRYFHSPRLEIVSIQLSRLYQLSSLDSTRTQNKIFSLLKIEFLETGGNGRNSALSSREERAWAIWSVPDCTRRRRRATLSNHFPRIIPDNPRQIVTYLEQFRSPSLAKLLRWGDEYCFLTVSSIRYNSRPRGIAPSAR